MPVLIGPADIRSPRGDAHRPRGRGPLAHNYPAVVVGIIASTLNDDLPVLVDTVRRFLAADGQTKG